MSLPVEYADLLGQRLTAQEPAVAVILRRIVQCPPPDSGTLYAEIAVSELALRFPVSIFYDGQNPWECGGFDVAAELHALPPLLSAEEEERFILWEDGPSGPQHALVQPIDGAEAQIVLPWLVAQMHAAGLDQFACEVCAGLHDSAEQVIISAGAQQNPQAEIAAAREAYRAGYAARKALRDKAETSGEETKRTAPKWAFLRKS